MDGWTEGRRGATMRNGAVVTLCCCPTEDTIVDTTCGRHMASTCGGHITHLQLLDLAFQRLRTEQQWTPQQSEHTSAGTVWSRAERIIPPWSAAPAKNMRKGGGGGDGTDPI